MENNLMPKIAEMLGVKLGEYVIIENTKGNTDWRVSITGDGLKFDEEYCNSKITLPSDPVILVLNQEACVLDKWLRGELRIKGSFPKNGDKVFSVVTKGFYNEHGYPRIEEFEFDSSSQFHLLLKDKGLLHETLEEAVKCFEKDYNMFKELGD